MIYKYRWKDQSDHWAALRRRDQESKEQISVHYLNVQSKRNRTEISSAFRNGRHACCRVLILNKQKQSGSWTKTGNCLANDRDKDRPWRDKALAIIRINTVYIVQKWSVRVEHAGVPAIEKSNALRLRMKSLLLKTDTDQQKCITRTRVQQRHDRGRYSISRRQVSRSVRRKIDTSD